MKKLTFILFLSSLSIVNSFGQYSITPVLLPDVINDNNYKMNFMGHISPDGTMLVYFSNGIKESADGHSHHYYWTKRVDNDWSTPTKIELFNNIGDEYDLSVLTGFDGDKLYFYRYENPEIIFQSEFIDNTFSIPTIWNYKKISDKEMFQYDLGNPRKVFYANQSILNLKKNSKQKVYEAYMDEGSAIEPQQIPESIVKDGIMNLVPIGSNGLIYRTHNQSKNKRPEFHIVTKTRGNWSIPISLTVNGIKIQDKFYIDSYSEATNEIFFSANDRLYSARLPDKVIESISTDYPTRKITNSLPNSKVEPRSLEMPEKSKYYALLIAIEDYSENQGGIIDLSNPINDAENLKKGLLENYTFEEENINILKNPKRAEIINSFEKLSDQLTVKDNLLIFYAGHGVWDEKLNIGYWLSSDATTESKVNWISNSTIRDYIAGLLTKHTLLISDACFSGSIFKTREVVKSIDDYGFYRLNKLLSRKAMTSGTLNTVPDDSKFMKYLLKALSVNEKEYFPSKQLFHEIEIAIINNTANVPQFGTIQNTGDEGGDFIFIKKDLE